MLSETEKKEEGSELIPLTVLIDSEHETILSKLSKILDILNEDFVSRIITKELNSIQEEIQEKNFYFITKYFKGTSFDIKK